MAFYRATGRVPRQRHTQLRSDDGPLYYEELVGAEGFSSDSSLLYHQKVPSGIVDSQVWQIGDLTTVANHPLRPVHLRLHDLFPPESEPVDAVRGRRLVLANDAVRISYVVASTASPLYRNAMGDECVFVESGNGVVETSFGALSYGTGDYIVIPRATTHRWLPAATSRLYAIEANSHIVPPKRYLSKFGQFLEHAPYCERDLRGPSELIVQEGRDVPVYIKHRGRGPLGLAGTIMVYENHPFDVVGWDGCLYPFALNIADYMPITGKVHQPPPAHQVFDGHNFVICNFVPRKVDYHELAVPVPYYHSNVDSDEVMFYVDGDYEARKGSGITRGSISLHPGGHAHGPQPGAIESSLGADSFNEVAVMIDTFHPLELGEGAVATDDGTYAWTWSRGRRVMQAWV